MKGLGWIVFVSRRLLVARRSRGGGAGLFSILGIAAGVTTLVAVLAVMNGFQMGMIENILEVNSSHLRLYTPYSADSPDRAEEVADLLRPLRGVRSVTVSAELQTLVRGYWAEPRGAVIRAVPPDWLQQDPGAADQLKIVEGDFDLRSRGGVVVGQQLARSLGVRLGDTLAVTHIPGGGLRPAEEALEIRGIFRTGYLDYDLGWAFVSLATAAEDLKAREELVLGVKLDNRYGDQAAAELISRKVGPGYPLVSWRVFNRGIFGALRAEKGMMTLLISLIFLVVSGNIYQLLRRSILERSEDIAILRALGAPDRSVRSVFILEGWMIGVVGSALGLLGGLFLALNVNEIFAALETLSGFFLQRGARIFSPSHFYIQEVPVRIFPEELFLVCLGATGVSVFSAMMAVRAVAEYRPMELLRSR
ncbi:lipoprotein-releasing system permease protein [Alkalispirochaeta americana]|uniref:Lipoprotein-releasing system permease protein n=1 Tax=Alkalispirochaeta americana TaxID=159291 RepID=A0A1N6VR37_9SPIO|nr:ABC transporter permease [Alkalispirochaeta americana]SIQ80228.1 lipoprotein-releasing system permease protein [Alkalispirochaeta americana]